MAESDSHFDAKFTAIDAASEVIENIRKHLGGLGQAHEEVEKKGNHAFEALTGHVNLMRTRFGNLRASVGELGSSFGEFLPFLAGLGAAGTVAGMFELTERASEAAEQLERTAKITGVTTQQMQQLSYAAKMTDTPVDRLRMGMETLNRVVGEGSRNKAATSLFAHLKIPKVDLKDPMRLLTDLSAAFEHTKTAAMRAQMAWVLFGQRSGQELLPFLMLGPKKLAELNEEAGKFGRIDSEEDVHALTAYGEAMKKAQEAVSGFEDAIAAKLAPVLRPIIDATSDWIAANREWIATDIAGSVRRLATWVGHLHFGDIVQDVTGFAHGISDLVARFGGLQNALGGVALALGAELTAKILETLGVMKELGSAVIGPVIGAIGEFVYAIGAGEGAMFAFNFALMANPVGVVIGGLLALGSAAYEIWNHWKWLSDRFHDFFGWMERQQKWYEGLSVGAKIVLAIAVPFAGAADLVKIAWEGVIDVFERLWNILQAVGGAIGDAARYLGINQGHAELGGGRHLAPSISTSHLHLPSPLASVAAASGSVAGGVQAHTKIDINLNGLPQNAQVRASTTGSASTNVVRKDRGAAWGGAPG